MTDNPLMAALRQFEATEANLIKLERLWAEIQSSIPQDIVFGEDPQYEEHCRAFGEVFAALPLIDGWKPDIMLSGLNDIAQNRFDAKDLGLIEVEISVESAITAPGREIREYRFRFNKKRRALIRDTLIELIDGIDATLRVVRDSISGMQPNETLSGQPWETIRENIAQIDVLLGSAPRPPRWRDLRRHVGFGQVQDLIDIEKLDWPVIKSALTKDLYADDEPLPVAVKDLGDLVAARPRGDVVTELQWHRLDEEGFERLIFNLISNTDGYENPQWLTRTNAPDRGRDLSVMHVSVDPLSGTRRRRIVIQCRHWLTRSISLPDVITIKEQMSLWASPGSAQ